MNGSSNLGGHFTPAAAQPAPSVASVESKAEHVRSKAQSHYERNARTWVATRYTQLLLREGNQPALRPDGAVDDRKAHLMRAAIHLVERKQHQRLARIERAAQRMSGNGNEIGR